MFDQLKGLANLPQLMAKARDMQDRMKTMQEELAARQFTADAAGGMVTAIVNGRMEVVKVRINPEKFDGKDIPLLEDVIVAAIMNAQMKAAITMRDEMQKISSELGLPPGALPGM